MSETSEARRQSWRRRCAAWHASPAPKPPVPCPEYDGPCLRGCDGPLVMFSDCLYTRQPRMMEYDPHGTDTE